MVISELACIYMLHDNEVTVAEDKINVLIKAAGINVGPFWPGIFEKTLSDVNIASLICNVGVGGPAPAADGAAPASTAVPTEERKKEEAKKKKKNPRSSMMT
ncbi:60S acidic ribosomal protein P1-like [Trichosurus vulpecula]|uniref:60S acidic ribosomal protein P1-like n=1 Tax=Trichosurus vulpecula TaxID=9337 RepID=UPI00186AEEDE|nr:60S acidic ribosomal protein P1-like [Trichosurus vulpecula]